MWTRELEDVVREIITTCHTCLIPVMRWWMFSFSAWTGTYPLASPVFHCQSFLNCTRRQLISWTFSRATCPTRPAKRPSGISKRPTAYYTRSARLCCGAIRITAHAKPQRYHDFTGIYTYIIVYTCIYRYIPEIYTSIYTSIYTNIHGFKHRTLWLLFRRTLTALRRIVMLFRWKTVGMHVHSSSSSAMILCYLRPKHGRQPRSSRYKAGPGIYYYILVYARIS